MDDNNTPPAPLKSESPDTLVTIQAMPVQQSNLTRAQTPSNPLSQSDSTNDSPRISSTTTTSSSSNDTSDDEDDARNGLTSDDVDSQELSIANNRPQSSIVHDHILPLGWSCNYDNDTDQYKFEYTGDGIRTRRSMQDESLMAKTPTTDHVVQTSRRPTLNVYECKYGYHFPSSPTPSMISDLAKQVQKAPSGAPTAASKTKQVGYGKFKFTIPSDEEEKSQRLREMFPTATPQVVDQMIRIYHGREGLIKAALISLGYKRSTEYDVQQSSAQSPLLMMMAKPSSKKLYEKLISYFPDRDETLIKQLMYKHKEVEHEIISVLVESGQSSDSLGADAISEKTKYMRSAKGDRNGAIMKLRYLKSLYPTCDETELYHLLHCNDLNAQKVMEIVEKRNHKKANMDEVMEKRKSQAQQLKAYQAAQAARSTTTATDQSQTQKPRPKPVVTESRLNDLKENLKKDFGNLSDETLVIALECADYNDALARKFLEAVEPVDDELFKQRFEIPLQEEQKEYMFPCKGVQTGQSGYLSVNFKEFTAIPREVIECENALALMKVDAATFTQDDGFEECRYSQALGRQYDLARGSNYGQLESRESLRKGPQIGLRCGSAYKQVWAKSKEELELNKVAKGRDESLKYGSNAELRRGHNPKLIKSIHPFFLDPKIAPFGTRCGLQSNLFSKFSSNEPQYCVVKKLEEDYFSTRVKTAVDEGLR